MLKRGAVLDLGYAAILDRNYTGAERRFRILLRLVERDEDKERIANRSMDVAFANLNQGLIPESSQLYERAFALGQELGSNIIVAEALSGLSKAEQARGNVARAKELALNAKRRFDGRGIIRPSRADQFAVINSQQTSAFAVSRSDRLQTKTAVREMKAEGP
jgi:hypothetical protein